MHHSFAHKKIGGKEGRFFCNKAYLCLHKSAGYINRMRQNSAEKIMLIRSVLCGGPQAHPRKRISAAANRQAVVAARYTVVFKRILLKIGIQINGTYKVHVDKRHNLWVLQGQNAFYFNFSHKTLKTFKIENFPEETPELSISDDGENLYLLWNSTLLKLENNAKKCKRVDNISLPSNSIIEKHIYTDYHGGIWLYSYTDEQIFYKKNIKSE